MKNIKYLVAAILVSSLGNMMSAQIKGNQPFGDNTIPVSSAFMDASATNTVNDDRFGKGLIFPRADITKLVISNQGTLYNTSNNPNRFDGMIVYNTASTGTPASGTISEPLFPGFWYYENKTANATGGVWRPIVGGGGKENILTTETVTNRLINNAQIYAIKGTFTASGASTAPTAYSNAVVIPSSGSLYRITIFQAGTNNVYANSVYSYDKATGNLITGSPSISVVYPSGSYDYIVEYLK